MQHDYYKGYDISDFPMAGGEFRPRQRASLVELDSITTSGIGDKVEIVSKAVRVGAQRLPKGALVKSRLRYQAQNKNSGISGIVDLVSVKDAEGNSYSIVLSKMPMHKGDQLEVRFIEFGNFENVH